MATERLANMDIKQDDINAAVKEKLITAEQAKQLWSFWRKNQENIPSFHLAHVMYYFGGLLAISAITLFVTQAWDQLRGFQLFIISSLLFFLGCLLAHHFIKKKLLIPAGIMSTFSLALIPLAIYNIQSWLGFLPNENYHYTHFHDLINWYWVPMELTTLVIGFIMLYLYDFPFLLFPISISLWYMSMDLFSLLFSSYDYSARASFSIFFGLFVILFAAYMDFKYDERKDYAYWLYIFGVIIFWGGLSCQHSNSELSKFFYCLINIGMILISVFLNRKVFAVFGAFGILGYLGHLSFSIFANSIGFPIALVLLGIAIIFAATLWSRVERKIIEYCRPYIPKKILKRMQF